jgi:hypothetical protein
MRYEIQLPTGPRNVQEDQNCWIYRDPETGEEPPSFLADLNPLTKVKIVYHKMSGGTSQ